MAASIFDTLSVPSSAAGTSGVPPTSAATPRAGTTQRLGDLIQGGKANSLGGAQTGLALDTEEEQGALTEAQAGAKVVQKEGDMMTQRLQQKEQAQNQEFDFQAQDWEERRINSQMDIANKSSELLTRNEQNYKELDVRKQKSIAMFSMSLARFSQSNYLEELQTEATRHRLDNEVAFKEALQTSIFADEEQLLKDDLNFKSILNADDRTFKDEMAVFDIDLAISISASSASAKEASTTYAAVGEVVKAGVQIGAQAASTSTAAATAPTQTTTGQGKSFSNVS